MDNKVTVIGFTGAGKTTYLTGMYICMSTGIKDFTLVAKDDDVDLYLEELWNKIIKREKPDPTDRLETYKFHISHNFKPVCDFAWIDYPGGLLADPLSDHRQQLENDIEESDCLLLMVDGGLLSGIMARDPDDYQQKLENSLKYNVGIRNEIKMLSMLSAKDIKLPPIGIVVTKCDLIDVVYENAIRKALRNSFSALFDATERIVLQISVSLGGNIEDGISQNQFYNIEQPIAFAVLSILMKYLIAAKSQNIENSKYIEVHDDFFGRIVHKRKIGRAKENIKNLGMAVDKWSSNVFKLIDLFSDKKTIFVDGEERNLRDYYREIFEKISEMEK